MFGRRIFVAVLGLMLCTASIGFCQGLESDWNDFLHYTAIGNLDLAKGYGQAIVESNPDPLQLLTLSEENPQAYALLVKLNASNNELTEISGKILSIIEQGRFIRRSDPKIINEEITRLSSTMRGRITAVERLKNAGEYAVVYMIAAMQDSARQAEMPNIVWALPQLGKPAVKPLIVALEINDPGIKMEVIRALGEMRYSESLGYLKNIVQTSENVELRNAAVGAIQKIDASAMKLPASELFYQLGVSYYNHVDSLAPPVDANFANIWFWDEQQQGLTRQKVDKAYYNELMAMRAAEWSLKADPNTGKSIALWIGSFFKAEATGIAMPDYFGTTHASAMTYAKTAGPEYLHQALARALKNKETFVVLNVVEALGASAGEKSLMFRIGTEQPLMQALDYNDASVRLSAALAIANAKPAEQFPQRDVVAKYLGQAITGQVSNVDAQYAPRAMDAIASLAQTRNKVIDLVSIQEALIKVAQDGKSQLQAQAINVLAYLDSPDAQRVMAALALDEETSMNVKLLSLADLTASAKMNGNMLTDDQVQALYAIISSEQAPAELRSAAASVYGSLNLPSMKVKQLILDQAKN